MLVMGIETSCDETAAAVVAAPDSSGAPAGAGAANTIRSNVICSQIDLHRHFGGVVPEVASRQHLKFIEFAVQQALVDAQVTLADLDAIAVTHGPGLIGSLLVGVAWAKGLAAARGIPLVATNHLEGHIYSNFLRIEDRRSKIATPTAGFLRIEDRRSKIATPTAGFLRIEDRRSKIATPMGGSRGEDRDPQSSILDPQFPLLTLIVSGGHTTLVLMRDHGVYEMLGHTRDDAAGESFDKVARMLQLGFPGGPAIDRAAQEGNPHAIDFPRADLGESFEFSFSGLKTAALRRIRGFDGAPAGGDRLEDVAASFQEAVVDALVATTLRAADHAGVATLALAGGVAANRRLRERLLAAATERGLRLLIPPPILCTDNAAMIACAGAHRFQRGECSSLDFDVHAHLPLALPVSSNQ